MDTKRNRMDAGESLDEIRRLAQEFRDAILCCPRDDWPLVRSFPRGACGDASILLGEYLFGQGQDVWEYVAGERDGDLHSHAWLEKDSLIVDITADQFEDVALPVIVTYDRSWHRQFLYPEPTHPALIGAYDARTQQNLTEVYQEIVRRVGASDQNV